MTSSPRSPRLLKGGIVLIDPDTSAVERIIPLQYNPDTLTRTLQIRGAGEAGGDRSEALRLTGPPTETIKLEAELDASDRLEEADAGDDPEELSLHPVLAALETLVYPSSADLRTQEQLAAGGSLEIAPAESPLALFVWGAKRILPVRLTELTVTEEAFDPELNPIRAKVSLTLRVLSAADLGAEHKGASLFSQHHQEKERLATLSPGGSLQSTLGIKAIP